MTSPSHRSFVTKEREDRALGAGSMAPPVRKKTNPTQALERLKQAALQANRLQAVHRREVLDDSILRDALVEVYRDRRVPRTFTIDTGIMMEIRNRAFEDFDEDLEIIVDKAPEWLDAAVTVNRKSLEGLRSLFMQETTVTNLHVAAYRYFQLLKPPPSRAVAAPPLISIRQEAELVEMDVAAKKQAEKEAAAKANDPVLSLLFMQPNRRTLFPRLAKSREETRAALEEALEEATRGLNEFHVSVKSDLRHIWRYPPVVVGTLGALGVAKEEPLMRFMVEVARLRSEAEDRSLFVGSIAIALASLTILSGPLVPFLLALDSAVSGLYAYHEYEREAENDLGRAAGVLGLGEEFTDRPSNYGPVLLLAAGAFLNGSLLLSKLNPLRFAGPKGAKTSAKALKAGPAGRLEAPGSPAEELLEGSALNRGAKARTGEPELPAGQRETQSGKVTDEQRAVNRTLEEPSPRGVAREKLPAKSAPPALAQLIKTLGLKLVPAAEIIEKGIEVISLKVRLAKQALDGMLYVMGGVYYFLPRLLHEEMLLLGAVPEGLTAFLTLSHKPQLVVSELWRFASLVPGEAGKFYGMLKSFLGPSLPKLRDPEGKIFAWISTAQHAKRWDVQVELAFIKHFAGQGDTRLLHILKEVSKKFEYRPDAYRTLTGGGLQRLEFTSFLPEKFPKASEALDFWRSNIFKRLEDKLSKRGQLTTPFASPYGDVVPPGGILCVGLPSHSGTAAATFQQAAREAVTLFQMTNEIPDSVEIVMAMVDRFSPELRVTVLHHAPASGVIR